VKPSRSTRLVAAAFAVSLTLAAGCGGDDGDEPSIPQSGVRETTTTEATTTTVAEETTTTIAGDETTTTGADETTTTTAEP
jgi:hypothetical protein